MSTTSNVAPLGASKQMSLFTHVLHAYPNDVLSNEQLYERVAKSAGLSDEEVNKRVPVGQAGEMHSPFKRQVRWLQQTMRAAGILERVEGERGLWKLTKPVTKDLNQIDTKVSVLGFSTDLGIAILGSCDSVFAALDAPIHLAITSPPYPLASARKYGNPPEPVYVDWVCRVLEPVIKNLVPGGSIVLNISNDIFLPKSPARSMYCERLLLALNDRFGLSLMDRLVWHNPQKPPGPFQYASKARTQLNVSYEPLYWLCNDPSKVRSNNRRVLQEHSERHMNLMLNGGEKRNAEYSDGAYRIREGSYGNVTEGRIPKNMLTMGHRCKSQSEYKRMALANGLPAHGAPMPMRLASFLVEFLSQEGDTIAEPFGGSMTVPLAAELLGRRWIATEIVAEYLMGGSLRFENCSGFSSPWIPEYLRKAA